jgi:hypothetical protein
MRQRATKGDEAQPAMFFNRVAAWPFGPPKGMKNRAGGEDAANEVERRGRFFNRAVCPEYVSVCRMIDLVSPLL